MLRCGGMGGSHSLTHSLTHLLLTWALRLFGDGNRHCGQESCGPMIGATSLLRVLCEICMGRLAMIDCLRCYP